VKSLWELCPFSDGTSAGTLHARDGSVALRELAGASILRGRLQALRDRSILLATHAQLPTALALLELDGVARRVVLCTPDLTAAQLAAVSAAAGTDAILVGAESTVAPLESVETFVASDRPAAEDLQRHATRSTEWILLTSGTTGQPKLVVHDVESLAGALPRRAGAAQKMTWSTFYDIRRYGGLQIYLRAVLSGSDLVLSSAGEPIKDFLTRAAAARVTHISGTPSHWRRALMSGDTGIIDPEYVRLSGEVADQTVLDTLRAAYPKARIAHAFASTEAGVAFDVNDGLAGFPREFVDQPQGGIELKVQDGTLWIRSGRTASRYLNAPAALSGDDGYVDTGDMVELEADRYYFRGRKGGIINVGGLKVYPEEVESVLNADPRVRVSRVMARRNPITGALIVAEVVLSDPEATGAVNHESVKEELLQACRRALAAHKVPAMLRFVPSLELTAAGKLVRPNA
jgi:acyl-coenzyme A synthetase/AMP-(fatty) acid ligase